MGAHVVAYARYSSDNQREESIDAQLRVIRDFCEANDYTLIKAYTDEAKTATTDQRPEFQQMIKDSASGAFKYVIVHKLDRFSRDRYDSAIYKRELKLNGVRLLSVLEHLDDSPESIILESVLEGMSEYYSRNLAREVIKGLNENALKCKHNGGIPPLGYDVGPDKKYVINPYEAEAVRMIFQMYTSGANYVNIISGLKKHGYKTKIGKDFTNTSLNSILNNEKYTGVYTYGRTKPQPRGGKRTNSSRADKEILKIPGGMPRIIDDETWGLTKKLLKERATMAGKGAAAAKELYLLTGLLKCGDCGSLMHGDFLLQSKNKKKYTSYKCSGRKRDKDSCKMPSVNRDKVEGAIIAFIEQEIFKDNIIEEITARLESKIQKTELEKQSSAIGKELKDVEGKISNIVNAVANGFASQALAKSLADLEERKTKMEIDLAKVTIEEAASPEITEKKIRDFVEQHRNLRTKTRQEQKNIIRTFVKEIRMICDPATGNRHLDIYTVKGTIGGGEPYTTVSLFYLSVDIYRVTL